MALSPLDPKRGISLRDRDAAAPAGLPDDKDALDAELAKLTSRLSELQYALFAEGKRALLVVLQARDAGGKDGVVRHVFGPINQMGCTVTGFGVPSALELKHDYLWRVHQAVPPRGSIGIWNRSHYEDVLAVRVKGLAPEEVWKTRYEQINAFERILAENDVTILKFFLHISKEEQRKRLLERLEDPTKNWKFDPGDLADRDQWDAYTAAYKDALSKCSTPWAPWYLVPADRKKARDVLVARVVVETLEKLKPKYPKAAPEVLAYAEQLRKGKK